jgi:hypothetical protein
MINRSSAACRSRYCRERTFIAENSLESAVRFIDQVKLASDFGDFYASVLLAVAGSALVVLTALELLNVQFLAFFGTQNFGCNLRSCNLGGSKL